MQSTCKTLYNLLSTWGQTPRICKLSKVRKRESRHSLFINPLNFTHTHLRFLQIKVNPDRVASNAFPNEITIEDARKSIQGDAAFKETVVNDLVVFDYDRSAITHTTFPNPATAPNEETSRLWKIKRECKGLKFSLKTQKLVSRPYHKFWSIGETLEATEDKIPLQSITSIVEQYDGTMITPVKTEENAPLQLVTRNGDTLNMVNDFVARSKESGIGYEDLCTQLTAIDYTPIFEFCSPNLPKIVTYVEDSLVLTGIRHNISGDYVSTQEVAKVAKRFNIPTARPWEGRLISWRQLRDILSKLPHVEGFVIHCQNGNMYKLKTTWWHKTNQLLASKLNRKSSPSLKKSRKKKEVLSTDEQS